MSLFSANVEFRLNVTYFHWILTQNDRFVLEFISSIKCDYFTYFRAKLYIEKAGSPVTFL